MESSRNFDNEDMFTNTGSYTVNGGNLDNTTSGTLSNSGTITIDNFTQISNNGTSTNTINGIINIINSSTLRLFGGSTLNNLGAITNTSGTIDINTNFTNDGTITNDTNGTIDIGADLTNNSIIINNNIIDNGGSFGVGGFINASSGILVNNGDLQNDFFGTNFSNIGALEGINTGHEGDFTNVNILSPGNDATSIGTYTLEEKLILESTSILEIEIESLTSFDNIVSAESTKIGMSTLNITLLNGFDPAVDDTFEIITASSISNTFNTVNLPVLTGGKLFEIAYNSDNVTLTVVSTLSINDIAKDTLTVSPNPSSTYINIGGLKNSESIVVYNYSGQSVVETEVSPLNNNIDISKLSNGVYFINTKGTTIKFVKQ